MGNLRRMLANVLVIGLWAVITTLTGCSRDQMVGCYQGAAKVMEVCQVELPELPVLEADGSGNR